MIATLSKRGYVGRWAPTARWGNGVLLVAAFLAWAVLPLRAAQGRSAADESGHQRMRALLKQIAERPEPDLFVFPDAAAQRLGEMMQQVQAGTRKMSAFEWWRLLFELGLAEVRAGRVQGGIERLLEARQVLAVFERGYAAMTAAQRAQLDASVKQWVDYYAVQTHFYLGVAYMRMGEDQNCCLRHNAEACILPLRGGGIHTLQQGSRRAIEHFSAVLEHPYWQGAPLSPQDEAAAVGSMNAANLASGAVQLPASAAQRVDYQQAARWLLNIAHMTVGDYPDRVPEKYRVAPQAFQSQTDFPRFENVAPKLKLDTFNLCGGAVVDDFDGDGYLDIVTSTWDLKGQMRFFRNNGDGTFADRTRAAGLLGFYGGLNMVQADYDNDGDTDIFVVRGAWLDQWGRHPNSLLRNDGDGTFTDLTFAAGLGQVHYPTKTAAWGDYDNDGDLDLFIANETGRQTPYPSQLFRNDGDGTFTDVAAQAGAQLDCFGMGAVWGDYDGDRHPDLYVSCGPNRLLRNNGDGTFAEVGEQLGVRGPKRPFAVWFWDFDNDGHLDIFASASSGPVGVLALNALGVGVAAQRPALRALQESVDVELMHLYRNDGRGGFGEVGRQYQLTYPAEPMGANFGDLNNDGYLDFYLATGDVAYAELRPNVMFLNGGDAGFANVTMAGGFGHLQKGHGVSFADIDNDGDQDVYVQMGGAFPGDKFNDALFENPGFGNRWIGVELEGRRSNRSAIGARIHARILEGGAERSVFRHVNSGGSFGCNPLRQTLGLGRAERLVQLEVFWPTTGRTQVFGDVAMDQIVHIVEGEQGYEVVELKAFDLGGS